MACIGINRTEYIQPNRQFFNHDNMDQIYIKTPNLKCREGGELTREKVRGTTKPVGNTDITDCISSL